MALIAREEKVEKIDLRIKIPNVVKNEIDTYCRWAEIEDMSHFFTEAAKFVLSRDKDWQRRSPGERTEVCKN